MVVATVVAVETRPKWCGTSGGDVVGSLGWSQGVQVRDVESAGRAALGTCWQAVCTWEFGPADVRFVFSMVDLGGVGTLKPLGL